MYLTFPQIAEHSRDHLPRQGKSRPADNVTARAEGGVTATRGQAGRGGQERNLPPWPLAAGLRCRSPRLCSWVSWMRKRKVRYKTQKIRTITPDDESSSSSVLRSCRAGTLASVGADRRCNGKYVVQPGGVAWARAYWRGWTWPGGFAVLARSRPLGAAFVSIAFSASIGKCEQGPAGWCGSGKAPSVRQLARVIPRTVTTTDRMVALASTAS